MATVKMGKREKLVVGVIIGLAAILATHILIFSKRAKDYVSLKRRWESLKTEYGNMGSVQNPKEITKFRTKTQDYVGEFNKLIYELSLDLPPYHSNPEDPENSKKIFQETHDFVGKLKEMTTAPSGGMKHSFLGKDGWTFPSKLPDPILAKRINIGDLLEKIKDAQEILRVISPDNILILNEKKNELKNLKKDIGIDVDAIDQLKRFGDDVPRFVLLAHANLILDSKPEDYPLTREDLFSYLNIQMPNYAIGLGRQMKGALDIFEIAKKVGIEDIKEVTLVAESNIYVNTKTGETSRISQASQAKQAGKGEMMGYEPGMVAPGMEEFAMTRGQEEPRAAPPPVEPGMPPPGPEPGMTLLGAMGGQGQQKAPDGFVDTLLAVARPIRIKVSGPNLNVMNFLYDLSHCKKTYEIDDVYFQSTQEGKVDCTITVNILAWVEKITEIKQETKQEAKVAVK